MKVCFVGAGSIGKRHIRNVAALCAQVGDDAEIHLLRATERSLESEIQNIISKQFRNISELDDSYDAVFITNPTYLHYDTILQLQDRSDCFFVEKPVFDQLDMDLSPIRKDALFYVACPLRYTRVLLEARKILQDSKVLSVRALTSSYLPDWRPGTDYRNTYSAHREEGGGVRIDLIHEWDYLTSLFGFPESTVCLYGKYSDLEIDSEDLAVYLADYGDKLLELHLDYFGKVTQRSMEVMTTEHVFLFDIAHGIIYQDARVLQEYQEEGNDMYLEELRSFFRMMRGESGNTNDISHALSVMRIAYGERSER